MKRFVVFILMLLVATGAHSVAGMRGAPGGDAAAESPERPEPPRDIAFITFETLPADVADNQWIGAGFSESLSAKIAAAEFPSLNVYERRMLAKTLRTAGVSQADVSGAFTGGDPAAVEKVTHAVRAAGVELIVIGSVQVAGPWNAPDTKFEFNGVVVDVATGRIEEGRAVSFSGVIGQGGAELFTAHSDLAREVIAALDIDPASAKQPNKLGEPETDNLDAYRHYILGLAARDAGDFQTAISHFEQATTVSESFIKALLAKGDTYKEMYEAASAPQKAQVGETWETKSRDDARLLTSAASAAKLNLASSLVSRCENENLPDKCTEALAALDMFDAMNASSSFNLENVAEYKFSGGVVFVHTYVGDKDNPDRTGLAALDVKTGKELWRFETEGWIISLEPSGDAVFVSTYDGPDRTGLVALDVKTGKELWQFETESWRRGLEHSGGAVFMRTYNALTALDEKTGKELWRFETEEMIDSFKLSGGAVFVSTNTYVVDWDNPRSSLTALNEKTGKELWRFEMEVWIGSFELSGGVVFVSTYIRDANGDIIRSTLTALDEKTGKELWRFEMESGIDSFELSGGEVFVMTSIYNENNNLIRSVLTALDKKTGKELWHFEPEGQYNGIDSFKLFGGMVFASLWRGGIAMIDARTGTSVGNILDGEYIGQFIVNESMLYAASGNKLFEYDLKTNTIEGVNETYGDIRKLEVSDGMISALTETDVFYVFSPSSGGAAADNTAAMLLRAQAELLLGKPEKAKETLLALIALKPGMAGAWLLLFKTCDQIGDVSCLTTAFINIHLRSPGISEYSDVRDAWLRQSPFSETGTEFIVPESTDTANASWGAILMKEDQGFYYDVNSGKELWRFEPEGEIDLFEHSGGVVFVNTYVGNWDNPDRSGLVALEVKTGKELWRYQHAADIDSFKLSGGSVFIHTYVGDWDNPDRTGLVALDEKTGKELWRFESEREIISLEPSGGAVFVDTFIYDENWKAISSGIVALDEKTGKELWRFETEGGIDLFEHSGGVVFVNTYVGDSDNPDRSGLVALEVKTGKELWRFETERKIISLEPSGGAVFVHTDYRLTSLDVKTGKELWRFETEANYEGIDSFELSGGAVFIHTSLHDESGYEYIHSGLVALGEKTGKELWRFETESGIDYSFELSGSEVFVHTNSRLTSLDVKTGKELWRFETETENDRIYSIKPSSGAVFVETYVGGVGAFNHDRTVFAALDKKTGKELWRFETESGIDYSFKLSGGALFVKTDNGLTALDEKTGEELWQCNFDKATIDKFGRSGDNLFIQISLPSAGSMVLVMDLNKAKQMVADGKKWW